MNTCRHSLDQVKPFYIRLTQVDLKLVHLRGEDQVHYFKGNLSPVNACMLGHLNQPNFFYVNLNVSCTYSHSFLAFMNVTRLGPVTMDTADPE